MLLHCISLCDSVYDRKPSVHCFYIVGSLQGKIKHRNIAFLLIVHGQKEMKFPAADSLHFYEAISEHKLPITAGGKTAPVQCALLAILLLDYSIQSYLQFHPNKNWLHLKIRLCPHVHKYVENFTHLHYKPKSVFLLIYTLTLRMEALKNHHPRKSSAISVT